MKAMTREQIIERLVNCFFEEEEKLKNMRTEELEKFLQEREYDCPDLYPNGDGANL